MGSGKEALLQITNNLTVESGPSNSDYALAAAVQIRRRHQNRTDAANFGRLHRKKRQDKPRTAAPLVGAKQQHPNQ